MACTLQGLFVRQKGNHNFPRHLVLWLSFQVTTTPFCKCLSQTPLVSTATRLMPVLPVAHLNIACFYFSVSSPITGPRVKQVSRQTHSSQEKAFSQPAVQAPGCAQPVSAADSTTPTLHSSLSGIHIKKKSHTWRW